MPVNIMIISSTKTYKYIHTCVRTYIRTYASTHTHNMSRVVAIPRVAMTVVIVIEAGMARSVFSGIPVAIGGTDLNPAVFYGDWVITISNELARSLALEGSESYSNAGGRLLKKDDPTKYFCKGDHLMAFPQECESYHAQLRATTIFAVAFSTLLLAIIWSLLGKLKLTRYVSYMPYSISEAFLACVGYKVFYYAIKFCDFDPRQFFTAAFIGIALYFIKALHIGNPTIMTLGAC